MSITHSDPDKALGPFCRDCGTRMKPLRKAGHSPFDGQPYYLYVCPNDRWWKLFSFHSMWIQGRYLR